MTFAVRTLQDGAPAGGGGGGGPPASFVPVTHQYSSPGSYTEMIPGPATAGAPGPSQLVVELGGSGGGGSFSPYLSRVPPGVSGSGGSGALCRSTFPLTSSDYGATFTVTIAPGGVGGDPVVNFNGSPGMTSSIVNSSFSTSLNMQAGGGQGGTWNPGAGGQGGVASGGQVNLNGNAGQGNSPTASYGGVAIQGNLTKSGAGGNASVVAGGDGSPGASGAAAFAYT